MNDRITINPKVLGGKPVVAGTRMSVEFVVRLLAQGWSVNDVLKEYDHLTPDDIQACVEVARARRAAFERVLAAVPHAEPIETDRLPE